MITDKVAAAITAAAAQQFKIKDVQPEISYPEGRFGDLATNVAFRLAGQLKRSPQEVATELAAVLTKASSEDLQIKSAEAVGGFINITLSDLQLWQAAVASPPQSHAGQTIVVEYSDPNPFKVLHAGHLYTSVVGDAIANLLESAGASVHRVNYGGDVGLHAAKSLWAIVQYLGGEHPEKLDSVPSAERSDWLSARYVEGTSAYEDDAAAKAEITATNQRIYQLFTDDDHKSAFARIYWTCRQWSYDYFDEFYGRIGIQFEKYYPESQVAPAGLEVVRQHLGKVYEESDGAIVFKGDKYDLHTRVFINSAGLPTYEAKEVGVIMAKWQDYHFDRSIVITGNDIIEYMKVVLKSIEQFEPDLVAASSHLTHGMIKLAGGAKMSSRKGNILRAVDVLQAAAAANRELAGKDQPPVTLAAVKYAFLKQRVGGDIIYDPAESVSLVGNSGPYLQYAHARACSILAKAGKLKPTQSVGKLEPAERSLVRQLMLYHPVVAAATAELSPHTICTYLYELCQEFNRFYEGNRVVGDERAGLRLALVQQYAATLKQGLALLGIAAPERI
jgi:arginyl-tRNA synthetase